MAGNSIGSHLRLTTFGESHGPLIGGVLDGLPAGLALEEALIQPFMERRRPGKNKYTSQRREEDKVRLISGVFEGRTTGTPIAFLIENKDQRSKDYSDIKNRFRPGHADYTYWAKYGQRDFRGGGRASARETAVRVAAGAIAHLWMQKLLGPDYGIRGALVQMGPLSVDRSNWDWEEVEKNPFFLPDAKAVAAFEARLEGLRREGSSCGAVIELEATGIPAGLGEPVYDKLDADLARALMSVNAVKAVEIGAGLEAASLRGEENADEMRRGRDNRPQFLSNKAGGILGGISSGQPIVARFAVKPTSSIRRPLRSLDRFGRECEVVTKGRHDPCVGIRAVPIGEAMMALTLADHLLRALAAGLPLKGRNWDEPRGEE